jgi:hypothetical protein
MARGRPDLKGIVHAPEQSASYGPRRLRGVKIHNPFNAFTLVLTAIGFPLHANPIPAVNWIRDKLQHHSVTANVAGPYPNSITGL